MIFKLLFISILWTSLSYGRNDDYGIPEKARVIHIPQIHFYSGLKSRYPSEYLDKIKEYIAHTQLKIAKIIMKYPNHIYIEEGVPDILINREIDSFTYDDGKGQRVRINKHYVEKNMRHDFYQKSYGDLTDKEKDLLYKRGSILLLFFLGHINKIHPPSISPEKFRKVMDKIDMKNLDLSNSHTYNLATLARESQLKKHVKSLLKRHPEKRVFIGYGGGHYLSDVFNSGIFYRIPNHFAYSKKYTESVYFAIILLQISGRRYYHLEQRYGTQGVSEAQVIQIIDNFQKTYDIIMDYVKNKDLDERTGYYCPDKKEYLTVEELLKKAILAFNAKDYIQKRHSHYKSCQSAFATK